MTVERQEQLDALLHIGQIVGKTIQHMAKYVEPGISTKELDEIGAEYLAKHGANSAPMKAYQFPGATCISLNDEAAHGIPGDRVLQAGDLVNIDVSAEKDGFWADSGSSFPVPPIDKTRKRLLRAARRALDIAIQQARAGRPINGVGKAVENFASKQGYYVVRELSGHGVGGFIHEKPSVPHYYERRIKEKFAPGMVLTLEPFISVEPTNIVTMPDGWTLKTNGTLVAQYEHTLVITENEPILVTAV